MGRNPQTITNSTLVKKGHIFDLRSVPVGPGRNYDLIDHPGAVVILAFTKPREIVLISEARPILGIDSLIALPAGCMEPGEDPAITAVRELEEETGYKAAKMEKMFECYSSPGMTNERIVAFVASDLTPGPQRPDDDERIDVITVDYHDAIRMVIEGKILVGHSLAALSYFHAFYESRLWVTEDGEEPLQSFEDMTK